MKKRNIQNKALERGGLMLEALAMLGLIAVVTPTMYKKSAERTLEVEDINTAQTVRTYSKAAESYMSENMATILADMEESGATVMEITPENLSAYLPYKFDVTRNLYDYQTPKISIYKNGNNLTSFILFPAKANEANGIGQERTSRIAALIGSNGGYVTEAHKARGVGGVWSLDEAAYGDIFAGDNSHPYSLVTASTNVLNGNADAGLDNSKYLQRTFEGEGQEWRNTMRTDLYLGGFQEGDEYQTEHPAGAERHSIRNVSSLIIGSELADNETSSEGADGPVISQSGDRKYGLYINSGSGLNVDAFVAGSLEAAANQLFVNDTKLEYGLHTTEGVSEASYGFTVDADGNMTNSGDLDLARDFYDDNVSHIILGGKEGGDKVLYARKTDSKDTELSLLHDDMFFMNTEGYSDDVGTNYKGNVVLMNDGYKKVHIINVDDDGNPQNNYITPEGINYNAEQKFPVHVGSNMKVDGLLAARQVDAQNIRLATLSAGSDKIDDAEKWLNVDAQKVKIKTPKQEKGNTLTQIVAYKERLSLRAGFNDNYADIYSNDSFKDHAGAFIEMFGENDEYSQGRLQMGATRVDVYGADGINLRTDGMRVAQKDNELNIRGGELLGDDEVSSSSDDYHRTKFDGGHVDVVGANLRVVNDKGQNVLSVLGNKVLEQDADLSGDKYADSLLQRVENIDNYKSATEADKNAIHMAAHGNVAFTSIMNKSATDSDFTGNEEKSVHYLTMGVDDNRAAVNIARGAQTDTAENNKRLLFVDLNHTEVGKNNSYVVQSKSEAGVSTGLTTDSGSLAISYSLDPGTIYIRKGLLEVVPDANNVASSEGSRNSYSANTGKGIIRASRLVANNVDENGAAVRVPQLISDSYYQQYNGVGTTNGRYDTYMVNPAYTSVMNDIKLVSRGGARLSDVLPDFITKSIYVVKNDYDDTLKSMKFKLNGNTKEVTVDGSGTPGKNSSMQWASPYSGVVPAPQCPPGYGRVITVTPTGIRVAQTGHLAKATWGGKTGLYVNEYTNTSKISTILDNISDGSTSAIADNTPRYGELYHDNYSTSAQTTVTLESSEGSNTYTVQNVNNLNIKASPDLSYVLAVKEKEALVPMTMQQSTWFKALAVPLYDDKLNYYGASDDTKYNRGWAILLGYIYPTSAYETIASKLGYDDGSRNLTYDHSDITNAYYWNIFPVRKTSLEAYATTYCYFDRGNLYNMFVDGYSEHIDNYDVVNDSIPTNYNKTIKNEAYKMNLNDPTMKYNELW